MSTQAVVAGQRRPPTKSGGGQGKSGKKKSSASGRKTVIKPPSGHPGNPQSKSHPQNSRGVVAPTNLNSNAHATYGDRTVQAEYGGVENLSSRPPPGGWGCGTRPTLTNRDFWKHCQNKVVASTYAEAFRASTIPNYGLVNSQTTGTEGWSNVLAKVIQVTFPLVALNGRRGLEEAIRNDPRAESIRRGFFCDEATFNKIVAEVLPTQQKAVWAAADREGPQYLRFDTLTIQYGLSWLCSNDLAFYYRGIPYNGMNACQWQGVPDTAWPPGVNPNATVAQVLGNSLADIALEIYNVDFRALLGIVGLGAFTGVTLTLRAALTAPYPAEQIGQTHPWLCAIWFMMQQYFVAFLNSRVCPMNYRFPTTFLLGGGFWFLLREFSEIVHCLNLSSGGTQPIDTPTLSAAMARIVNYFCSIIRENNRGGFAFKKCDLTTAPSRIPTTVPTPTGGECDVLCSAVGPSVNDSTASGIGEGFCQCPTCCEPDPCPEPCPEPCPPNPCDACPVDFAPSCFPPLRVLIASFIEYAYVFENEPEQLSLPPVSEQQQPQQQQQGFGGVSFQNSSLPPSGFLTSSSSSSSSSSGVSSEALLETKGGREESRSVSGGGIGRVSRSSLASSFPSIVGWAKSNAGKWAATVEGVFSSIETTQPELGTDARLANLYLELGEAVQATNLDSNYFTINPASFLQSLMCMFELILRETLGRSPTSIRLNHSPGKISKTAFSALTSAFSGPEMTSIFISCTNDIQSGQRYDYCALLETIWRVRATDFQAFYRGKRLEGMPPCRWSRLKKCVWSVDPDMLLSTLLQHPSMGIFLVPYTQDNRSFTAIPGLDQFTTVDMTLRDVLKSPNPLSDQPFLDIVWFIIQEAITGYNNGNVGCINYRFPAFGGFPFMLLRAFSDAIWALNTSILPDPPPIDTPTLVASMTRVGIIVESVAHENRRGVKNKPFWDSMTIKSCTRTNCKCTSSTDCLEFPNALTASLNLVSFLESLTMAPEV